jgi:hypothetical protein
LYNGRDSLYLQEKGCALNLLLSEDKLNKWLHSLLKEQDMAMVDPLAVAFIPSHVALNKRICIINDLYTESHRLRTIGVTEEGTDP